MLELQLEILFDEVKGLEGFMKAIFRNLEHDSMYGTLYRVSVGAFLSTVDAGTDIYVISTYYYQGWYKQANMMLLMMASNLLVQLTVVLLQHKKQSTRVILMEVLISILYLRPIVDAVRVGTYFTKDDQTFTNFIEMMFNKTIELGTESIPGCVLQVFVYMLNADTAGGGALLSIVISALTTGFTSAMIGFDSDTHVSSREATPQFYGESCSLLK